MFAPAAHPAGVRLSAPCAGPGSHSRPQAAPRARRLRAAPRCAAQATDAPAKAAAAAAGAGGNGAAPASPLMGLVSWVLKQVRSQGQLMGLLRLGVATGKVPERLLAAAEDLYTNYRNAVVGSRVEGATDEYVARVGGRAGGRARGQQPFMLGLGVGSARRAF